MRKTFYLIILFFISYNNLLFSEWTDISTPKIKENLYSSSFITIDKGYVVGWGSSGGVILYTSDGGSNWDDQTIPGIYPFTVNYVNEDLVFVGGFASNCNCGTILYKNIAGSNWKEILFDDVEHPFNFSIMDIESPGNGSHYASGYNGSIYKTDNSASDWKKMKAPSDLILKSLTIVNDTLAFCLGGKDLYNMTVIYKSTNNANSFDTLRDFKNDFVNISSIYPLSSNELLLFGDRIGKRIILKSDSSNKMWNEIYSDPVIGSVMAGYMNSYQSGIAVCDDGTVLRTNDSALTWQEESKIDNVELMHFFPIADSAIPTGYAVGINGKILKYQSPAKVEQFYSSNAIKVICSGETFFITIPNNEMISDPQINFYDLLGRNINIDFLYENHTFMINSKNLKSKNVYFLRFSGFSKPYFSRLVTN